MNYWIKRSSSFLVEAVLMFDVPAAAVTAIEKGLCDHTG